jgi:hypothetical protein
MWMMVQRRNGTPSPTQHLIHTMLTITRVNRLRVGAVEDVEVVGGEGDLQAPWVEDEARMQTANSWQ